MSKPVFPSRSASRWYVVQTNPCCEERATRSLSRSGFGVYSPQRQVERQHARTKAWVTKSYQLMPGYLFVDLPHGQPDWWALRRCDGVKGVLGAFDSRQELAPFPVSSVLVERIMAAQLSMEFDDTRAAAKFRGEVAKSIYQPGVEVMVRKGPFASFGALVSELKPNGDIAALINVFGRLTPITLIADQVELAAA